MNFKVLSKFAVQNLKTNKMFILPFLFSSVFMFMLFYIMSSLTVNEYVLKRHYALGILMNFGEILVAIFSIIFTLYCNNVLDKQRAKEFALYSVLGLEKKHIAGMIFIEKIIMYVTSCIFTITGGYVLGKVLFLVLAKIMGQQVSNLTTVYNFNLSIALKTIIFISCVYLLIYFVNITRISTITPIALFNHAKKVESEPNIKKSIFTLGVISLAAGYIISLTVKGVIESIFLFFIASLLVILGTYLLFMPMSIFVLKLLRKNKYFYHKPQNFLSVSGMLYRMKSNAVGIATICVFSTSVILSLSSGISVYSGAKNIADSAYPTEYQVDINIDLSKFTDNHIEDYKKEYEKRVKSLDSSVNVTDLSVTGNVFMPVAIEEDKVLNVRVLANTVKTPFYMSVITLEDYNKLTGLNEKLGSDEIILANSTLKKDFLNSIEILGKKYTLHKGKNFSGVSNYIEFLDIVVQSNDDIRKIIEYYSPEDNPIDYYLHSNWNSDDLSASYISKIKKEFNNNDVIIKKENVAELYALNGGLIFLGLIIAIIFLTGTILVISYKRMSEAYVDREKYHIMRNIGLEDSLIKKTSRSQIMWLFFIPLIVGCVHSLVASKILSELLVSFGVVKYITLLGNIGIVLASFTFIYFVAFSIISRLVYRVVS